MTCGSSMAAVFIALACVSAMGTYGLAKSGARPRVYLLYALFMAAGLAVSALIAAGLRPPSPAQWIEAAAKAAGVVK